MWRQDRLFRGDLNRDELRALAARFLAEDVGRGDLTTEAVVPAGKRGRAWVEAREQAVVAGLEVARACFEACAEAPLEWLQDASEGARVPAGKRFVLIEGELRAILTAERTALNLLARMSGIATLTARYVAKVAGTPARILDTRKTTPGLRVLEKHAVRVGGGFNHRFGLDDGILIKDNHVAAAGGVGPAVRSVKRQGRFGLAVEVEVAGLAQLDDALEAGADAVLLDNMTPEMVAEAVRRTGGKVPLEASGGITLGNVRGFAETGVDFISVGALTHSSRSVDLSLMVGEWR